MLETDERVFYPLCNGKQANTLGYSRKVFRRNGGWHQVITQAKLKELLDYDPYTGSFKWRVKHNIRAIGSIAGCLCKRHGYWKIRINRKEYKAHRLAWLYTYGSYPSMDIDHINGLRSDNRIENLRDVTPKENGRNKKCHRGGHLLGTTFHKNSGKWAAQLVVDKRLYHLGLFDSETEAHEAYNFACSNINLFLKEHKTKSRGIYFHKKTAKWYASIQKNKTRFFLGRFITKEDAQNAYNRAKQESRPVVPRRGV
jgi:hypothetical protein